MKFALNTVGPNAGPARTSNRAASRDRAVALVITLLMLSVITFLAIAFLSMTSRDKTAVTASLDLDTAKTMSDAALARAQASAIAQVMSAGDILSYDLAVSHSYISNGPFYHIASPAFYDPSDVNYDTFTTNGSTLTPEDWAQNCYDLFWDPRPPVFVQTNGSVSKPQYDFRFWVDINRNAGFETNGAIPDVLPNGQLSGAIDYVQGEPEWIGVLKYPETNHGPNNPFIGRYAYMILPIGKTLDWNFIHNYTKEVGSSSLGNSPPTDYYIRDQGVGSWELNLAAFLNELNTNMYSLPFAAAPYSYVINNGSSFGLANSGDSFNDAVQFIQYRYASYAGGGAYPLSMSKALGPIANQLTTLDYYAGYPNMTPDFDPGNNGNPTTKAWPGSYNTNMFYDIQDVFDPTKTGTKSLNPGGTFANRFAGIMSSNDTYDRYTMQRMLACIGMGSQPEYGVYVYSNYFLVTNFDGNPLVPPPTSLIPAPSLLRTKVNINFDNSSQIASGPYSPMPTNPLPWTNPQTFFTNAADLLLRSQVFTYTNYVTNDVVSGYFQSNFILATFGITNIPVYNSTNPGIVYNEQVHRMLQLAANIYAEAHTSYSANGEPVPPVFRPQFQITTSGGSNTSIYITNFVFQTNNLITNINLGFFDFTNGLAKNQVDPNFWGVPWVIGAVKGLPAFDQFSYQNRVFAFRRLNFVRYPTGTPGKYSTGIPQYTNQFFVLSLTNIFGLDAWNPYAENYYGAAGQPTVYAYYDSTITITNNYNWGTNIYVTNIVTTTGLPGAQPGTNVGMWAGNAFKTFILTNFSALPVSYFSETASPRGFVNINTMGYLPTDLKQTTYPTYYWSVNVSNHCYYALFDRPASTVNSGANLIDFVNIGPCGSSFPLTQYLINYDQFSKGPYSEWTVAPATGAPGNTKVSGGVLNQILNLASVYLPAYNSVKGTATGSISPTQQSFDASVPGAGSGAQIQSVPPYANYTDSNLWAACDPLVHYTLDDLSVPQLQGISNGIFALPNPLATIPPLTLGLGKITQRYTIGIGNAANGYYILGDTSMTNSDAWNFPTNLFPSVGWLGRVHRGTPWQTVYLKPDDPVNGPKWSNSIGQFPRWVNSPYTYPTTDYPILDLFTAVPNDNAARGLLSVNNTNDAAWAAVFSGVVVPSNSVVAGVINPSDVPFLMDSAGGINVQARTNYVNGNFRHIGEIAAAPVLSVSSPYLTSTPIKNLTDDVVERIPQQTLGLLKVGYPQFVIYSWGQALRPKAVYSGGPSGLTGICTNYEITGEFLTRTICHVVSTDGTANAPQIVVDNYNIMPGN